MSGRHFVNDPCLDPQTNWDRRRLNPQTFSVQTYSYQTQVNGIPLLSNQRGYPQEGVFSTGMRWSMFLTVCSEVVSSLRCESLVPLKEPFVGFSLRECRRNL